jgi:hypothetical protein
MRCAALLLVLAGCALFPLGEADCEGVNWWQRGYDDGFTGAPPQDLRIVPECKRRFGVEVPRDVYLAGYGEGYAEWYRLIGSKDGGRSRDPRPSR